MGKTVTANVKITLTHISNCNSRPILFDDGKLKITIYSKSIPYTYKHVVENTMNNVVWKRREKEKTFLKLFGLLDAEKIGIMTPIPSNT